MLQAAASGWSIRSAVRRHARHREDRPSGAAATADVAAGYDRAALASDALAAVIVTIMLIPQSLAYALLAGLPAEMGLYASILPLAAYALSAAAVPCPSAPWQWCP
jgi:hypothetical protein